MFTPEELSAHIAATITAQTYPEAPAGLYEPIAYGLDAGGKRLRPTLLLLCYNLYADDVETAMPAALGIETYHNHTLLHDDVMDQADVRRGRPTVWRKWDANTAILSGDTMLIRAFRHVMDCRCRRRDEVLSLFARTTEEVCQGQQYDMNFETRTDVTLPEYVEMIRLKTAVLVACAAKMGALIADAPTADADALYRFAEQVGLAFQLQDDYLDVYGNPATFGKNIGGDILCGKKTFVLLTAYERADATQRRHLTTLIDDKTMVPQEKIAAVTALYNKIGVAAETQRAITHYYNEARAALNHVSAPRERCETLWQFAEHLLGRNK